MNNANMEVYKYRLSEYSNKTDLIIRGFVGFLHVGEQDGSLCVWVLVNPEDGDHEVKGISVYGTGQELECGEDESLDHIGTVIMKSGLVWHVFSRF